MTKFFDTTKYVSKFSVIVALVEEKIPEVTLPTVNFFNINYKRRLYFSMK